MLPKTIQEFHEESWCHICGKRVDEVSIQLDPETFLENIIFAKCHGKRFKFEVEGFFMRNFMKVVIYTDTKPVGFVAENNPPPPPPAEIKERHFTFD